jgi:hypothetical protein
MRPEEIFWIENEMVIVESACIYMCHKWQRESFDREANKRWWCTIRFEYNDDMRERKKIGTYESNLYFLIIATCDGVLCTSTIFIDFFIFDGQ